VKNSNSKLGSARVLLLKAEFYVHHHKLVEGFLPEMDDTYTPDKCLLWL